MPRWTEPWRTGYHYTVWTSWLKIRRDGLVPQPVAQDKVDGILEVFKEEDEEPDWDRRGTWIWKQRMTGASHVGSVLFQVATKAETTVALLRVRYRESECLSVNGLSLNLRHTGRLGKWRYHTGTDEECADMAVVRLPAERVELVESYDVTKELCASGRFEELKVAT